MDASPGADSAPRRAPFVVAGLMLVLTAALLLRAEQFVGANATFVPITLTLFVTLNLITTLLLTERYRAGGSPRLLVLSWGYLWAGAMTVAYALVFPHFISSDGLLGATPSSSAWVWVAWHTGFPLLLAAGLAPWPHRWQERGLQEHGRAGRAAITHVVVLAAAVGVTALCTVGSSWLPTVVDGMDYDALSERFGVWIMGVNLAALLVALVGILARGRTHGLEVWALVAAVAGTCDALLTLVSMERFTLGWYAARSLSLLAAAVVLATMLAEITVLHRQANLRSRELAEQNRELLEAQRLREHLIAVVSHDMRSPLTGLQGYLELLSESGDELPPAQVARMYRRSTVLTKRLTLLTEDLLATATLAHGQLEVYPEQAALPTQLSEVAATFPDLDLVLDCPADLLVLADTLRLQQILTNLVRNAVQHGVAPVTITAAARDDRVEVRVGDAGPGVPAEFVPRLFEAYSRADDRTTPGSGLGLSVVRELAELMGGHTSYDSGDHTFVVDLPRTGSAGSAAAPDPASSTFGAARAVLRAPEG